MDKLKLWWLNYKIKSAKVFHYELERKRYNLKTKIFLEKKIKNYHSDISELELYLLLIEIENHMKYEKNVSKKILKFYSSFESNL